MSTKSTLEKPTFQLKLKALKEQEDEVNIDDWFQLIEKYQELDQRANKKRMFAKLGNPQAKEPMALIFTADWHLGGKNVNYKQWKEDFLYMLGLPSNRFRIVTVGDLIDNFQPNFKSAEAVFGYMSPKNQKKLLDSIAERLEPYLEASCWGNHDHSFDEKNTGKSDVEELLKKYSCFFYGKGFIEYQVGREKYNIMLTHIQKGNSWFHQLHGNIRSWMDNRCELVVGAHKHSPAYMRDTPAIDANGMPVKRHLIQVGTYKDGDDLFSARFFKKGVIENTTVVLHPEEHKVVVFDSVNDAAKWMGVTSKKVTSFHVGEK